MKKKRLEKWIIFLIIISFLIPHGFLGGNATADAAQTGTVMASSLNVRAKASTTAAIVKSGGMNVTLKKGAKVNILKKAGDWYYISVIFNKNTAKGYVLGSYIKITATATTPAPKKTTSVKPTAFRERFAYPAKVTSATLNIRSGPATTSGIVVTLKKGATITIVNETILNSGKWYGVTCNYGGKKKTGYVSSAYARLTFSSTVKGQIAGSKVKVRSAAKSNAAYKKNSNGRYIALSKGKNIYIMGEYTVKGEKWFRILFYYGGKKNTGYVMAKTAAFRPAGATTVPTAAPTKAPSVTVPSVITPTTAPTSAPTKTPTVDTPATPTASATNSADFETQLSAEGFHDSYKQALRQLHQQYPNWIFKAYNTGLDWNAVIEKQSKPGKNLLSNNKSIEWKSMESGAYDWTTDKFTVFDGSTWVTASKAAVEYYVDPRNFLTATGIFQFELLKYQKDYQDAQGVENVLKGTPLYNASYTYTDDSGNQQNISYGQSFVKAAEYSGVSPYHLASRVKQEVVTSATTLSASVSGTYTGYEGLYNFYNIGANDSAGGGAIANGLKYAKNGSTNATANALYMIPWTNPYKSIVGGSHYIGSSYINRGQDTIYLQKFNVTPTSTYVHQYMTNVEAPSSEAKKMSAAYSSIPDTRIVFSIPVYLNMPAQPVSMPASQFNPNNRLKSLQVVAADGEVLAITPTFDQTTYNYDLIVSNDIDVVEVKAAAASKKATVNAGGYTSLNVGSNQIKIPVVAENGTTATYTVNIVRE